MKINRLEFENFRNFKNHNVIEFQTNGIPTIIYGTNGDGKTTLHQLFQWIFYGEVHFNKTASNKMYNLELEEETPFGGQMVVKGTIDFEHPNRLGVKEYYSLTREWTYTRSINNYEPTKKCVLLKKVGDDWKPLSDDPAKIIENILPSGLSQYFFFDGESMIADLNKKGKESAKSLKKALYSIFDLDIYQQAIIHIGTQTAGKSTVLGNLYLNKSETNTNADLIQARGKLNAAINQKKQLEESIESTDKAIRKLRDDITAISEQIGNTPQRSVLEAKRAKHKKTIKTLEDSITKEKLLFGSDIYRYYPNLLMSAVAKEAQNRIGLKVGEEHLTAGVTKELIDSLKHESTCVCGHEITEVELANFEKILHMLPPLSYKYMYDNFTKAAQRWSSQYDPELLSQHLAQIFEYKDTIQGELEEIHQIDEELKTNSSKDELILKRSQYEKNVTLLESKRNNVSAEINYYDRVIKQFKANYEKILEGMKANQEVSVKIEIMEEVLKHFKSKLEFVANDYSAKLRDAIQHLIDIMLTSTRVVQMSNEFELSVKDSHGDEAKSEGQFAVVSFAYIGGIFKLLSEEEVLKNKEFPLILDGPFSKLDVIQRQNVINTIPSYAPQIVLFSKDDITDCFDEDLKDSTWTLFSNDEKNVTVVKKGYFPEVFRND